MIASRAVLTCMRKALRIPVCQMGMQSFASSPMVVLRLWALFRAETVSCTGSFSGTEGTGGCSCRANLLHSLSLMPSGTAFARDIVRRPCMSLGVEILCFLKEERGGLLTNHGTIGTLYFEKGSKETGLLMSHWMRMRALVGVLDSTWPLGTFLGATPLGVSKRQHC